MTCYKVYIRLIITIYMDKSSLGNNYYSSTDTQYTPHHTWHNTTHLTILHYTIILIICLTQHIRQSFYYYAKVMHFSCAIIICDCSL